jgi:GAF domain-containing protein
VPIAVGQRVLGVLDVQHNVLNGLQQQDVDLLESIANQIAIALRNAQLFTQVQEQSQELVLINRVVSAVAASMDLQKSMQVIATELAHAVAAEQTGIALLNADGQSLTVVAEHFDESASASALGVVIPVEGNSLTQQVLETRQPIVVQDAQHNPLTAPVHDIMRQRHVQTLVILPMIAGDAVIGTVGIDSLKENYIFTAEQLRLAETIIFQAATAVQNARLFEQTQAALAETQQRSRELALINEVVSAVAASLDLRTGLQNICSKLAQAVHVAQVRIALLNEDNTRLTIIAEHYDKSKSASALGFVIPVAGNHLTQQVLETRQPVVVADAQHNPVTAPVHEGMRQQGIEALVVLPILAGNQVIGTVGIDILEKGRVLSAQELGLAQTIVFQVATAVQNAQLFEQTEEKARELAVINEVAQAVSQQLELDHLLNAVYEQIGRVMEVDAFLVALYDAKTQTVLYPFVYDSGQRYQHPPSPLSPNFKLHQVILEGQSIHVNRTPAEVARVEAESAQVRVGDEQKISASLLYVPLQLGSQIVGALSVQSYTYNAYDAADVTVLSGIANHVAVALENSQLFEQTQVALAETDLLYQASARLNAAQSYGDVLATLREHTQLGRQAQIAHLAHFDQPAMSPLAAIGTSPAGEQRPARIEVRARWSLHGEGDFVPGDGLADLASTHLLQAGEPTLIEDVATDSRLDEATRQILGQPAGVHSAVFVPLVLGQQWIGTVGLGYGQPMTFPERDVRHLMALAGQAAVTMQTIHLLEESNRLLASEQRQRLITDTLLQAASRMAETLSESELRGIMVEQIYDILLPDQVNLYEWLEGDRCLRLDRRLPAEPEQAGANTRQGHLITPEERPDLWQVLSDGGSRLEAVAGEAGLTRQHYRLPWLVGAKAMGVVEVYVSQRVAYRVEKAGISEEDQVRCQGVVRQAAIALQNARSYEQEQARARREQVLREIAAKVRGSADVDTIMRTAVQEIGQTLGRRTFLYLEHDNNGKTEAQ